VTLMGFTAQLQNGNGLLQWTTSAETNSKYFEVQRSVDGVNFSKIGTVNAAGNSNSERRYTLVDKSLSAVNYYRVKMVDADNSSKMSEVRILRNENINQRIYVLTNPFADHIDLRFAQLPKGNVNLRLVDLNGKLISKTSYSNVGYTLSYNKVGNILTTGVYVLQAEVDGQVYSYKVVRQ
jgi:trimeric autotransporter adhesin